MAKKRSKFPKILNDTILLMNQLVNQSYYFGCCVFMRSKACCFHFTSYFMDYRASLLYFQHILLNFQFSWMIISLSLFSRSICQSLQDIMSRDIYSERFRASALRLIITIYSWSYFIFFFSFSFDQLSLRVSLQLLSLPETLCEFYP